LGLEEGKAGFTKECKQLFEILSMSWLYLMLAAGCEIAFAGSLKLTQNFTNLKWSVIFILFYVLSIVLLNKAVQTIPIGTAYAVWTGIGAAGTVLIGIFYFKEPYSFWRIFFLCTLILSIVGLKFVSTNAPAA
jgi:quaternary ammonium compound-resistance protein SugE